MKNASVASFSLSSALQLSVVLLAVAAHLAFLASVPMGFYIDESSIGYNAWSIATHGQDEHGAAWPLYFEAFGEYKNPLYVYLLALVYKVFGFSLWSTRLPSVLCWLAGSGLLYALGRRISTSHALRLYMLIALSFTPWLFALSRIAFEVIALYPLLALYLWSVHTAYERSQPRWALVAGLAAGLALYAYSTFRLLAALHVAIVVACYMPRGYWRRHALLCATFAACALPLLAYMGEHPQNLTARFALVTYLDDATFSTGDKLAAFADRYAGYFGAPFLLLHGDENLRHHSGFGGELLLATVLLAALGAAVAVARDERYARFVLLGALIAPVAAALTREPQHSLRAFSLAIFALMLSFYGARWLHERYGARGAVAIAAIAALQAAWYLGDYFVAYPAASALAFQNYGFEQAWRQARAAKPQRIVVSANDNQAYINLRFFGLTMPPGDVPAVIGNEADVSPHDVFISIDPALTPDRPARPPRSLYIVRRWEELAH